MLNIIPRHIANEFRNGKIGGSFAACVIHVDISGFTAMTESLLSLGKEGAEVLSSVLNRIMKSVIGAIYRRGGFVTGFAGDSLTGVFPEDDRQIALKCAEAIQNLFRRKGLLNTPAGDFKLSEKIGVASGLVTWGIVGSKERKAFYYMGEPIGLSAAAADKCAPGEMKTANNYFESFTYSDVVNTEPFPSVTESMRSVSKNIASLFTLRKILEYRQAGEFRDVASVFVSVDEPEDKHIFSDYIKTILENVESMGGYFNTFDFTASPPRFLILFGAPVSFENNLQRAVDLADSIRRLSRNQARIGIGYGRVYAGSVGTSRRCTYTVLGSEVNLASRLMEVSDKGEILLTKQASRKASFLFRTERKGNLRLKGVSEKVDAFTLSGRIGGGQSLRMESCFVGRISELDKLLAFMKPVLEGKFAGVAYIHGEAGIGKSRLAAEAVNKLGTQINIIVLECDEVLRGSLNPFISYFREYFNQIPSNERDMNSTEFSRLFSELLSTCGNDDARSDPVLSELVRTKSMLAALLGVVSENSLYYQLEPEQRFENTMIAIKEFFKAKCIMNPLVFVIENFSWADPDTVRVLSALTRNVSNYPAAVLVTSRKTEDGSLPKFETGTDITTETILLDTLDRKPITQLIERILGCPADEDVISFIYGKADGNPFFIEQFCLFLKEKGLIDFSDDLCRLKDSGIEVPESIRAVIIARLDRLSTRLRRLVQTAAVLGREFDVTVLSEMLRGADIKSVLHEGEGEKIWSALSEIIYIFRHALLRDAAYEMQLKKRLRILHGIAARAMEYLYGDKISRASDLAYHFEKGGLLASAKKYTEIAASCAEHDYRNEEAVSFYRKLLDYTDDKKMRLEINSKIVDILIRTGNLSEAESILRVNISKADNQKEMNMLADNLLNLGLVMKTSGDLKEAENLLLKSLSVYSNLQQKQKKKKGISEIAAKLTDLYLHLGDIDKAMEYAELGLASVGDSDDYLLRINSLQSTASVQWVKCDFDGCYESTKEILRLARQENNLSAMVAPTGKLGNCCWRKGRIGDAEQHYKEQLELALKVGYRQKVGGALNNLGNIYHIQGNYSESMNCYSRRLNIAYEMGDQKAIATAVGNIGVLLFSQVKFEEAGTYFEKMLQICQEIEYKKGESIATGNLTTIFLDLQELDKAMEYAKKKLDISEQIEDKLGTAQAYGLMGYVFRELENYDQAKKYFSLKLNKSTDLEDKKGCAHANCDLGDIARIQNDPVKAATFLDTAIRLLRELGARNLLSDFLLLRAEIACDLKKYGEASILVNEALDLSEDIGQQEIFFNLHLLKASILACTSDISTGVAVLEKMLSVEDTEEHLAALYCRMYRITGEEQHRRKALDLYAALRSDKVSRKIREKIRFLSEDM